MEKSDIEDIVRKVYFILAPNRSDNQFKYEREFLINQLYNIYKKKKLKGILDSLSEKHEETLKKRNLNHRFASRDTLYSELMNEFLREFENENT